MRIAFPKALREQVWIQYCGDRFFKHKCWVTWCENVMTPFHFEVGHNIPQSKGGSNDIDNLRPICGNCNKSMSNSYTIEEFSEMSKRTHRLFENFRCLKDTGAL